jgi:hypothetical protein
MRSSQIGREIMRVHFVYSITKCKIKTETVEMKSAGRRSDQKSFLRAETGSAELFDQYLSVSSVVNSFYSGAPEVEGSKF